MEGGSSVSVTSKSSHHPVLVIGGGTAGITVAARLRRGWFQARPPVTVVEPSERHFYQPFWTLVGGGVVKREASVRPMRSVIPRGVEWIQDAVAEFDPARNRVRTADGRDLTYDWLVVAAGLQINWSAIPGLRESVGRNGVCSNYSFDTVESTWREIRDFQGGVAIFTNPTGAVKCGGAPQKIMYLADDWFRKSGVRDRSEVIYASALPTLFAVDKYRATLEQVVARRGIDCRFQHELVELQPELKQAVFKLGATGERVTLRYDLIHVTPPMGPPSFIASSPLADSQGWLDVDKHTLRHRQFANVFGLGDCANLPTSKTGAAIRKQAPALVRNLRSAMRGQALEAKYLGYTSCPLVTGYGKLVMAEFDYDKQPQETFPIDQSQERWSMWLVKRYLLPWLYWHGMLKGRA